MHQHASASSFMKLLHECEMSHDLLLGKKGFSYFRFSRHRSKAKNHSAFTHYYSLLSP
jgi:hypothetical protein